MRSKVRYTVKCDANTCIALCYVVAHCEAQQSEMGVYSKGASVHVHSTVQCIAGCDASTQQIANASEFSNVWQIVMHSEVRWL